MASWPVEAHTGENRFDAAHMQALSTVPEYCRAGCPASSASGLLAAATRCTQRHISVCSAHTACNCSQASAPGLACQDTNMAVRGNSSQTISARSAAAFTSAAHCGCRCSSPCSWCSSGRPRSSAAAVLAHAMQSAAVLASAASVLGLSPA